MDIKISHNWLKDFLKTSAKPEKIAECLALSGPSVERVHKINDDYVYDIEITTNRVDTASIIGIAREASAILPQYGIKANFKFEILNFKPNPKSQKLNKLFIKTNSRLNKRVMAVVIEIPKVEKSPTWMKDRLEASGVRSLNNVIDITNYVMLEIGHPTHVFDFDKIVTRKLIFRLSRHGEELTTFDNKTYKLFGNDIVIEDGNGEIIDLPGIMGTKNSVVGPGTKKIIFFIDNNDPILMRKTSLNLGIRTLAVQLNEKGVDPELVASAFARGVELYQNLCRGKIVSKIYDIYHNKPKIKIIHVSLDFINSRIGVDIPAIKVKDILTALEFKVSLIRNTFSLTVPSFRLNDIDIPEDIVEEIARIYGYHNLPSKLMKGALPEKLTDSPFQFEQKIKNYLSGWGGIEVYNYSLVSKDMAGNGALKLKNPLGSDSEYLRTSLKPSLIAAAKQNSGQKDAFHLFEMANIYLSLDSARDKLPEEKMVLAGIFANQDYRLAKGILEAFFEKLHISDPKFLDNLISVDGLYYYEFEVEKLRQMHKDFVAFKPIPTYPAQIEDITFEFVGETKIGQVLQSIEQVPWVNQVELVDIFKNAYTFRIWYQHPKKTLTDKDVEKIREKIILTVKKKFGGLVNN